MKKPIFIGLAVTFALAIAVVCTTVSSVNSAPPMSDLMAKNIEALTQDPEGGSRTKQLLKDTGTACYSVVPVGGGAYIRQDGTWHECKDDPDGNYDCNGASGCITAGN